MTTCHCHLRPLFILTCRSLARPQFPPNVDPSPELQDLLGRILTSDPAKRITIAEIFEHPWFRKDLPPGVREMNANMRSHSSGYQTEDEIIRLLREAESLPLQSLDGQIDDALDVGVN